MVINVQLVIFEKESIVPSKIKYTTLGKIIIKNGFFSFEEIKTTIPLGLDDYEQHTLQFCQDWLLGKEQFLLHTSGSTGDPKPILLTRVQMEASAKATIKTLGLKAGDIGLVCLNTSYIAGIMMLVRGMVAEMDLLIVAPVASPLKELKQDLKIDFTALVPLQIQTTLEENNPGELLLLQSMKAILIGGAAVSIILEEKLQSIKTPIYNSYGMTETVSHIALKRLNGLEKQDYYQLLDGNLIDTDDRGCLRILSQVTNNQWIQTNDRVELIDENKFRWLGRVDSIINSGGIKIQPELIESTIEKILFENNIRFFFIAPLPHPLLGEAVTLFIEGKEVLNINLTDQLKSVLPRFELPKTIIYVDSFPRITTGKIDKMKIKTNYKNYFL